MVQWLKLCLPMLGGVGSIPVQGARVPHVMWPENQNIKQEQYCNIFNNNFKNGLHQKNLFRN